MSIFQILVALAGVLAVISMITPKYPLLAVAVLLLAVALFVK